ncbi:MAG: hypothetical protein WCJ72_15755 [Chryseobacterium sp.]
MNFNFCLIAGAIAAFSLTACNDDKMEDSVLPESQTETSKIEQPGDLQKQCSYVDQYWSSSAVLKTVLKTTTDTNFMNAQMSNIISLWGGTSLTFRFVDDASNPNSTYNAIS